MINIFTNFRPKDPTKILDQHFRPTFLTKKVDQNFDQNFDQNLDQNFDQIF